MAIIISRLVGMYITQSSRYQAEPLIHLQRLDSAQALGDYQVIRRRKRRAVNPGSGVADGLARLSEALGLGVKIG